MGKINESVKIGDKAYELIIEDIIKNPEGYGYRLICKCSCGKLTRPMPKYQFGKTKTCGCIRNTCGKDNSNYTGYQEISGDVWSGIISDAKSRNLEFCITIEQAWEKFEKQNRLCALTGVELLFNRKGREDRKERTASLDRIDSTKGYYIENIQWIHKKLNTMKMALSQEEFIYWCKKVANAN